MAQQGWQMNHLSTTYRITNQILKSLLICAYSLNRDYIDTYLKKEIKRVTQRKGSIKETQNDQEWWSKKASLREKEK